MAAAKRVLRYLCSTSGLGIVLGGRRPVVLTGHADASWADDQATQRSSQGYTFSLGSSSVSWRSTRSSSVLSSSCEAEIYAGAMAAQELRWLTYLLTNLGEQPRSPPVLYIDNKAMLALCREHRLEHRTKHIALRYFLARELQQRGQLRLAYVASQANTADVFTKALPPGDHQRFCTMLGFPTCTQLISSSIIPVSSLPGPDPGGRLILRREKFYVKLSKSEFALKKVQFLGHMVSTLGVHVDPKKIEAVRSWKTPENVKELQQFLGFANYYNRFVPQYAKIATPLTNLLKKNTLFKWEDVHQQAMDQLKTALTSAPVLILPDPEKDYVIEAGASDQVVGAVLMQDQGKGLQPIAFLSKKLHGAELNYLIHDKEALAIITAFKTWRCYLEGRKTTVYIDHCSLKYLKTQPTLSRRQVRWIDFLETHFDYDIVYKPGHKNKADALSWPGHVAAIQIEGMNPLLKGLFTHG
ncbi:unnamed protein product, partial [Closterium sp. NIES-54]